MTPISTNASTGTAATNSVVALATSPAAAPTQIALEARPIADMAAAKLQKQGIHPLLSQLFASRGVTDSSQVRGKLTDILPVSSLKNCEEMASILADCVESQKRIMIVSDYDCDGATACAVLMSAFRSCGMNADYLVPDRRKHGYGLTDTIIDMEIAGLAIKPDYIITVDNGISSHAGIERARALGIEVLVTDHHLSPKVLPNAKLIVNPNQPGCNFESKNIAGCGVAWYVAKALAEELRARKKVPGYDAASLLQFVALGTVADVVKLDINNRILIAEGLKRIRKGECTEGIKALTEVSKKQVELMSTTDFGFALAPRINAAGRLEHMACGIEALLTEDRATATKLANILDRINIERKEITKRMAGEAEMIVHGIDRRNNTGKGAMSIVVFDPEWNEGVVGIVAGRIKENRNRPTFVLCRAADGSVKGSGRSIEGLHMKHVLDKIDVNHPGILVKFGGHGMAAGVTIDETKIREFSKYFEQYCAEELTPEHLQRVIRHDGSMREEDLNLATIKAINREVWGAGFEQPVFIDTFDVIGAKTMGDEKQHLKLSVKKGDLIVDAVAWDAAQIALNLPEKITAVYQAQINSYRGNESMQVMVQHFPDPDVDLTLIAKSTAAPALLKVTAVPMTAPNLVDESLAAHPDDAAGAPIAKKIVPKRAGFRRL
jgi:single-stranded-DNA-specific exonuclease